MTAFGSDSRYIQETRQVLETILRLLPERPFAVRLPDGTKLPSAAESNPPRFTIVLKRPAALRRMFLSPSELAMGEGYIVDDFDIEGDMVAAFRFIDRLQVTRLPLIDLARLIRQLLRLERMGNQVEASGQYLADKFEAYTADGDLHSPNRDRQAS